MPGVHTSWELGLPVRGPGLLKQAGPRTPTGSRSLVFFAETSSHLRGFAVCRGFGDRSPVIRRPLNVSKPRHSPQSPPLGWRVPSKRDNLCPNAA